ncbi:MAG: DUF5057 domain-containing protein, partial [Lachnospiraceae bacterium]|nr:DUF5057 domain-containing protein [Lachnospiraceae bacterium]
MAGKISERKITIIVVAVVIAVLVGIIGITAFISTRAFEGNNIAAFDRKDASKTLGTKENPYTILEIVPNLDSATVGYLIKGQEPNDGGLEAISSTDKTVENSAAQIYANAFDNSNSSNPASKVGDYVQTYVFGNDKEGIDPTQYKTDVYNGQGEEGNSDAYSQYGYFEKVEEGTGRYTFDGDKFVTSEAGDYSWVCIGEFVYDPGYTKEGLRCTRQMYYTDKVQDISTGEEVEVELERSYSTEGIGKQVYNYYFSSIGDFAWIPNDNYNNENAFSENATTVKYKDGETEKEREIADAEVGDKLYMTRTENQYYWFYSTSIICNDLLRKELVGNDAAFDYVTQVVTVTPDQLDVDQTSKDKNGENFYPADELIKTADVIIIHDSSTGYDIARALKPDGKEDSTPRFTNDIPEKAMQAMIYRGSSAKPAAIIFDEDSVKLGESSCENLKLLYDVYNNLGAKLAYNWMQSGNTNPYSQDYQSKIDKAQETDESGKRLSYYRDFSYDEEDALGRSHFVYNYKGTDDSWLTTGFAEGNKIVQTSLNEPAFDNVGITGNMSVATMIKAINLETYGINQPDKLRILELQPNDNFYALIKDDWIKYYLDIVPWFIGTGYDIYDDVEVSAMTTYEFIGKNDDPNETYDLVIFGNKKQDITNGEWAGTDVRDYDRGYRFYNDTQYGGTLAYVVGDLVSTASKNRSGNKAARAELRYSGNDITKKKYDQLVDFAKQGPVVFADNLYNSDKIADESRMDKSSFVYRLACKNKDESFVNQYSDGVDVKEQANSVKKAMKMNNISLSFENGGKKPDEYVNKYRIDGGDKVDYMDYNYMSSYNNQDSAGNNVLEYTFTVEGVDSFDENGWAKPGYGINLYIDSNGNGIYEGCIAHQNEYKANEKDYSGIESERATGLEIFDNTNNVPVYDYKLINGHQYTLKKVLPPTEVGLIPWRLELYSLSNEAVRYSETGYTRIAAESKKTIKVLQMNLNEYMYDGNENPTVCFDSDYRTLGGLFWDYRNTGGLIDLTFNRVADTLNNYLYELEKKGDFVFVNPDPARNTGSKVKYLTNNKWYDDYGRYQRKEEWKNYLMQYDMLIIGFKDNASFTNDETFLYGYEAFRDAGKAIILSHDVVQDPTGGDAINNDVQYYLRDTAGQLRKYYNMDPNSNVNDYTYDNIYTIGYGHQIDPNNLNNYRYGESFTQSDTVKNYYYGYTDV